MLITKKLIYKKLNIVTHGNFDNELLGGIACRDYLHKYLMVKKEYLTY